MLAIAGGLRIFLAKGLNITLLYTFNDGREHKKTRASIDRMRLVMRATMCTSKHPASQCSSNCMCTCKKLSTRYTCNRKQEAASIAASLSAHANKFSTETIVAATGVNTPAVRMKR